MVAAHADGGGVAQDVNSGTNNNASCTANSKDKHRFYNYNIGLPGGATVKGIEVRLDAFNALNHTNFTGINTTLQFKSLTDTTITNLPYDSAGKLVNQNGVGTISSVGSARQLQLMARFSF